MAGPEPFELLEAATQPHPPLDPVLPSPASSAAAAVASGFSVPASARREPPELEPLLEPELLPELPPLLDPLLEPELPPELEPLLDPEPLPESAPELEPLLEPELLPELDPLLEPELLPELDPVPASAPSSDSPSGVPTPDGPSQPTPAVHMIPVHCLEGSLLPLVTS